MTQLILHATCSGLRRSFWITKETVLEVPCILISHLAMKICDELPLCQKKKKKKKKKKKIHTTKLQSLIVK